MGLFAEIAYGPAPAFSLSGATGAALAAGTRTYVVAFAIAGGIAGLSSPVAVQSSGAGGVGITIQNAFVPANATGYQVYRTTNGGGAYYAITGSPFALSVAGTQIVDSTSDAALVGNTPLPATVMSSGLLSTQRLKELTNSDNPAGAAAGVNYSLLQSVVWQAQSLFYTAVGVPYDDTTPSGPPPVPPTAQPAPAGTTFPPVGGNTCHWVGVGIVIAMLYDYRAQPWPAAEVKAAWDEARERMRRWAAQFGNARWAAPGTDGQWKALPPTTTTPDMDTSRFGRYAPVPPAPFFGDQRGPQSTSPSEY